MNLLEKPAKGERTYDYFEVMDYIDEKYNIDSRNYGNTRLLRKFRQQKGFKKLQKPRISWEDYGDAIEKRAYEENVHVYQQEMKKQQEAFNLWKEENEIGREEYLDFWHWLIDEFDEGIYSGSIIQFPVKEYLEHQETPTFVKEILQLLYAEYQEEIMDFYIYL